jgi:hypothetical protein
VIPALAFLLTLLPLLPTPQSKTNPSAPATVIYPGGDIPTPAELLTQLPLAKNFRVSAILPNGDNVLVYDTVRDPTDSGDFTGNHPHLAIMRGEKIIFDLDTIGAATPAPADSDVSGPAEVDPVASRLRAVAVCQLSDNQVLIAIAISLGADEAGGLFAFVSESSGQYKPAGKVNAPLSQLRFKVNFSGEFEVWFADIHLNAESTKSCIWCPTEYKRTIYVWRDGEAHPQKTLSDRHLYRPEAFFSAPFISIK